jgi:hypothetical protein
VKTANRAFGSARGVETPSVALLDSHVPFRFNSKSGNLHRKGVGVMKMRWYAGAKVKGGGVHNVVHRRHRPSESSDCKKATQFLIAAVVAEPLLF